MNTSLPEHMRVFLVNRIFTSLYGMTLGEWLHLLRRHHFAVDLPFWPRAMFLTGAGLWNSALGAIERTVYERKVAGVAIQPPVFILGHWRSGTTHLHNLLALDEQFAYPTMYQVFNPHTFLITERFSHLLFVAPQTRMMDNVKLNANVPFEDEFATCGTGCSPFLMWVFPRERELYERYLTFREVPWEETAAWQAALLQFLRKLTWKYNRPLLLKSPPHTGRIKLLLDMFPDARFVHIHRNPYDVFRSTQRQIQVSLRTMGLQRVAAAQIDAQIIRRYQIMYDAFFEEQSLIPPGRFHEVSFEKLEHDPVGEIQTLYETLCLPGFNELQPTLERYVGATASYRKNTYAPLPQSLRSKLAQTWRRSFEAWGYAAA
jgi:hypothetical protein